MMGKRPAGPRPEKPKWLDKPLMKLMKSRQKAWNYFRVTNSQSAYSRYKQLRNLCISEKRWKRQLLETGSESIGATDVSSKKPGSSDDHILEADSLDLSAGDVHEEPPNQSNNQLSLLKDDDHPSDHLSESNVELSSAFVKSYQSLGSSSHISVYDPNLSHPQQRIMHDDSEIHCAPWDSKRAKSMAEPGDDPAPSRVLFVRHLPTDVTEFEVANLAIPFGAISNMVITRSSGFGLIEMLHQSAAEDMVDYYLRMYAPTVRGKGPVAVNFSRYTSLTTTPPSQAISEAIINANKQYAASTALDLGARPRTVIKTQILRVPPSAHVDHRQFHQLFSPFGNIQRIVTFKSGQVPCAFIEFDDPVAAHVALLNTNGHSSTLDDLPGAPHCVLNTAFSRHSAMESYLEEANGNQEMNRFGGRGYDAPEFNGHHMGSSPNGHHMPYRHSGGNDGGGSMGMLTRGEAILEDLTEEQLSMLDLNVLSELAARMVKPLLRAALHAGGQQAVFLRSQAEVLDNLLPRGPQPHLPHPTPPQAQRVSMGSNQRIGASMNNSMSKDDFDSSKQSPVVYVSGLNEKSIILDNLFILFGVYGDVLRVKVLHNKKDSALIQFTDASQAQSAVKNLDKVPLFGKTISCTLSKNKTVTIPTPGPDDSEASAENIKQLNREFVGHRLHRFSRGNPRNAKNTCSPSKVLHFTNLPKEISDEDLTDLVSRICNYKVVKMKLIKSKKPMALLELEDLDKAISALIALHDYEIIDNCHIRVGFSKSAIRP